jgi:tRNA-modifying protein YgfZ
VAANADTAPPSAPASAAHARTKEASSTAVPVAASADYEALTQGCGLVDRSDRGKLALSGTDAVEFLNGQVTNELAGIAPGEGRYAAFLTHKGKMLGDLRILAAGTNATSETGRVELGSVELLLDTERAALQALFDMVRHYKVGYDVALHKRTLEQGLFSLIGPRAREVAASATADGGTAARQLPADEHSHLGALLAGRPVRLVSTELGGVDVLHAASDRAVVWEALVAAGAQAVPPEASEVVRVERGTPRYGLDLDEGTIPQEAGLNERAVSFTKGCYVGQETVARLHYRGKPNRHLRGLRMSAPAGMGTQIRLGERAVGALGSSVVSPALGPIGLALLRREAEPGATVALGDGETSAEVVGLPFAQVPAA